MGTKKWVLILGASFALFLGAGQAIGVTDSVMFAYQGRVKVHGVPYTGTGQFKFALINDSGTITLWSNDGTSEGGGEPTASIPSAVQDGVFQVMMGDPNLGMRPINRALFNASGGLNLRIWFSDGTDGFEQFTPDQQIVNPDLIAISTGTQDFTIYVNGTTGNDGFSGLLPTAPKKTIQAAVDMLPARIRSNVTIDVADGTYREKVMVFGIAVQPDKSLTLLGDESWTPDSTGDPAVRITGLDDDTTTTAVRDHLLTVRHCSAGITVKGFLFDHAFWDGLRCEQSTLTVLDCKASHCDGGFIAQNTATLDIRYSVGEYNTDFGVAYYQEAHGTVTSCKGINNSIVGISVNEYSSVNALGTGDWTNNSHYGIIVGHNSRIRFEDGYTGQATGNGEYGLYMRYSSYTEDHTRNVLTPNGTAPTYIDTGSATYF